MVVLERVPFIGDGHVLEDGGYLLKSSKVIVYIVICGFVWRFFVFQPVAYAQANLEESIDCTDVSVDYSDDLSLSREERLRLMDEAFFRSLNKFELCQSAKKMAEIGGTAGGGEKGAGDGSGETGGEAGTSSTGESVASSAMSGTETSEEKSQDRDEGENINSGNKTRSNGKLPEDIPPAENDDVLAAQIRYAAENETDPVKKKRLWNEYRKYKGMASEK